MGEATARLLFGATALCTDGHCGSLVRVVVEPHGGTVTHVVIEPEHRVGLGHLVPLDQVESADGPLQLRITKAQLAALPRSETVGPAAGLSGPDSEATAWPAFGGNADVPESHDRVPAGEAEIRPSEEVEARDGSVGRTRGVIVEAITGRLTHVLVEHGHVWHRREVAVPADAVTLLGPDRLVLSLTRSEVGALPASG